MTNFSGPYSRQTEMLDRIADAITGTDELERPTGNRALDSLERLAVWFETHGGIPSSSGSAAIRYDSTANWNAQPGLIAAKGAIYVYSDYQTAEIDGETVYIPGMKIGDGLAFLIDLPFANAATTQQVIDEITERVTARVVGAVTESLSESHSLVTPEDRMSWDSKVKSDLASDDPENLVFSI